MKAVNRSHEVQADRRPLLSGDIVQRAVAAFRSITHPEHAEILQATPRRV